MQLLACLFQGFERRHFCCAQAFLSMFPSYPSLSLQAQKVVPPLQGFERCGSKMTIAPPIDRD